MKPAKVLKRLLVLRNLWRANNLCLSPEEQEEYENLLALRRERVLLISRG